MMNVFFFFFFNAKFRWPFGLISESVLGISDRKKFGKNNIIKLCGHHSVCWLPGNIRCLSGKLWYLQHNCVGDNIVYHLDSHMFQTLMCRCVNNSTYQGWTTQVYIGSDNVFLPVRHQAITITMSGSSSIGPLRTNLPEIWIKIKHFPYMILDLKMWPASLGLHMLSVKSPAGVWMTLPYITICHRWPLMLNELLIQ